jgi:CO/xanthine dehydrogenase FAD-binding subunit
VRTITQFHAPESVDEAAAILQDAGGGAWVLAGGTDVMVRARRGAIPGSVHSLVSLHRITSMRGVRVDNGELIVGAATTASDLIGDPAVAEHAPILAEVAGRMASEQIRNVMTVGGNLANASPAGDLINPLLLLDARLNLASAGGSRTVPVETFFTGPGETVLKPGELIVEARFPIPATGRTFRFEKAGTRPAMECSFVTVGLAYTMRDGAFADVRVSFGAVAPTPLRGRKTEAVLSGRPPDADLAAEAAATAEEEIRPISDVRGSDCYRRALTGIYIRRFVEEAAS